MQNRYVADIGDFGKYGLLKFISSETKLRIGINWCLIEPNKQELKKKINDGKFTDYLSRDDEYSNNLKVCDRELYDELKNLKLEWKKDKDVRNVQEIEKRKFKIFCENIKFCDENINNRETWCKKGFDKLSDSQVIFFDPDNGLLMDNETEKKSSKHIYFSEIDPYFRRGQSLIIYQHANRAKGGFENELNRKILELKYENICTLLYKRGTARAFFIIPNQDHIEKINLAIKKFMETNWVKEKHFSPISPSLTII